jgi:uncharacterized protein (DUF433 family)
MNAGDVEIICHLYRSEQPIRSPHVAHMTQMETEMAPIEYIEERGGGYYMVGSRVSPASVIFGFRDGASPETLRQNFPSLSLAQVYRAIAFHLSHPGESETYLQRLSDRWNELAQRWTTARRNYKRGSLARFAATRNWTLSVLRMFCLRASMTR